MLTRAKATLSSGDCVSDGSCQHAIAHEQAGRRYWSSDQEMLACFQIPRVPLRACQWRAAKVAATHVQALTGVMCRHLIG